MRLILPAGCLLVLIVLVCGCTQSPSGAPVTAAATSSVPDPVLPGTAVTPHPRMAVNVTAEQTASEVIVQVTGGADAASLTFLNIRITNHDGSLNLQTISSPETGKPVPVPVPRVCQCSTDQYHRDVCRRVPADPPYDYPVR